MADMTGCREPSGLPSLMSTIGPALQEFTGQRMERVAVLGDDNDEVAAWVGHSVEVLVRVYAKCLEGQDDIAKRRIIAALTEGDERS